MTAARSYVSILFALVMGAGYAAAAPACVIQATDCDECDEESVCDSHLGSDGMCYCDPGHVWSDPSDPNNFDCDEIPPKPDIDACVNPHNVRVGSQCFCECGWNWCSSSASDLTCCADDSSDCQESETDVLSTGDGSGSSETGTGSSGSGSSGSESGSGSGSSEGSGSGSSEGSGSGSGEGSSGSGEG